MSLDNVGERIDRYTLGRVIGRGAMGTVYVANDAELGRAALGSKQMAPYPRAMVRSSLARALWLDAGPSERPRARALAEDAIRDIDEALATKDLTTGPMRKVPVLFRERRGMIVKWLAEHPL